MLLLICAITFVISAALFKFAGQDTWLSSGAAFWWVSLGGAVVALWIWWSTSYSLGESELRVRCSGVEWRVPIREIRDIKSRFSFSAGPALAFDRLEIIYGSMQSIMISPSAKETFLAELQQRRSAA